MNETSAVDSQLFVLRIWAEEMGDGRFEIRGQIKHIQSGEVKYYREWSSLQKFLMRRLLSEGAVDVKGDAKRGTGCQR